MKRLSDNEIKEIYEKIRGYYDNYLKQYGVKLPRLTNREGNYTKDALVLVYLAQGYPKTKGVSKLELTQFIRQYYSDTADVQQARHLAAQKGWFIASGTRGNKHTSLAHGEYRLQTLEKPYPGFIPTRRRQTGDWDEIKARYEYRCATCGSKEGEPNFHWPNTITKLLKAHMDPHKPLTLDNTIPRCEKCDRADRNNWVYDRRGRVIKLANSNVIKRSDRVVRWGVYKILYEEFGMINPNE